jgi:hypothetical protein
MVINARPSSVRLLFNGSSVKKMQKNLRIKSAGMLEQHPSFNNQK